MLRVDVPPIADEATPRVVGWQADLLSLFLAKAPVELQWQRVPRTSLGGSEVRPINQLRQGQSRGGDAGRFQKMASIDGVHRGSWLRNGETVVSSGLDSAREHAKSGCPACPLPGQSRPIALSGQVGTEAGRQRYVVESLVN